MKKYICLTIALLMMLSLCACDQQSAPISTKPVAANPVATNPAPDATTKPVAPAAVVVNFGDVIKNESIVMSIDSAEIKKELKYRKSENFSTSLHIDEGKQAFCLMGTIENVGGTEIDDWAFLGKLVIDGKYTYDARIWCPDDLEPLVETPYFLHADIPDKLVNSYSTAVFTFGFNNDFSPCFGEVEELDNVFTITLTK